MNLIIYFIIKFFKKTEPGDAFHSTIGNRIATWLFYLEVPEIGGATVFPRIGARLKPPRRSAAFWYNLFTSGDGDYRTRHVIPKQNYIVSISIF